LRRKVRRFCSSAMRILNSTRWIAQQTVWVCRRDVEVPPMDEYAKASKGAEKSCRTRRRKRGLRKGKSRSRGCHPRRSSPNRQTLAKPPSSRKVNHIGRKFIWAVVASNKFRSACKKFRKTPLWVRSKNGLSWWDSRERWTRFSTRATEIGVPYQAAFHKTFWDYIRIEVDDDPGDGFACLLAGLPRKEELDPDYRPTADPSRRVGGSKAAVDSVGNSIYVPPAVVCKHCRGLGTVPGLGYPNGCRFCYRRPTKPRGGRSSNVGRGSSRKKGV